MAVVDRRRGNYWVPGDPRTYHLPEDIKDLDAAWDRYLGTQTPPDDLDPEDDGEGSLDPEERARRKRRREEAMAYVRDYRGTWGLPLDIRANPRWGTKHLRLSDRQVDALLKGKERDAARSAARDPRQDEVVVRAIARSARQARVPDFVLSIIAQHNGGRNLSDRQVDALDRWASEEDRPVPTPGMVAADRPSRGPAPEGWYRRDGDIFKVQKAVHGSGQLYAKRLTVVDGKGVWEYAKGMVWQLSVDDALTVEEAEAFGKLYGVCGVCGKVLTDEQSIARGIGPVCLARLTGG